MEHALPYVLVFFGIAAIGGTLFFYLGCFYLSYRFKRPFLYFEVKSLASQGHKGAAALIRIFHAAILFATLFLFFGMLKFF